MSIAHGETQEWLRTAFSSYFEEFVNHMQVLINAEVKQLADAYRKLEQEQLELSFERARVEQAAAEIAARESSLDQEKAAMQGQRSMQDVLVLNVGGQELCSVQRSTLCLVPDSALGAMFSGRWDDALAKDERGNIFIDFPPDLFMALVDHLRQKATESPGSPVPFPVVPKERFAAFRQMWDYYGLGGHPDWEVAWGPVQVENHCISTYMDLHARWYAAGKVPLFSQLSGVGVTRTFKIDKTNAHVPWHGDTFAFAVLPASELSQAAFAKRCLMLSGVARPVDDRIAPQENESIVVEATVSGTVFSLAVRGSAGISRQIQPAESGSNSDFYLVVGWTYPWIRVHLTA